MMTRILLILSFCLLTSCSVFDSEQNLDENTVLVTASEDELHILNKTLTDIIYVVMDTNMAAVVDIADPCENPQSPVKPGEFRAIAYEDIFGKNSNTESLWFYWTNCRGNSETRTIKI